MNIMQMLPLVTKFMNDPHEGIAEAERHILPWWLTLEQEAGGRLCAVVTRDDNAETITISLYTSPAEGRLDLWRSYSLYDLVDLVKNFKNLLSDAASPANPEPKPIAAATGDNPGEATPTGNDPGQQPTDPAGQSTGTAVGIPGTVSE